MLRLIIFLLIVLALGFGFAWFADRPGDVVLDWQGMRYETSLMVLLSAMVSLVVALLILWWIVSTILRSPTIVQRFFRHRRRDQGYAALSKGLIAAGAGDVTTSRKLSHDSRKLLGSEPLVELLDAQSLLLEGDRKAARERFTQMLDDDETRLIALRGLHIEAEREGESEAARHYAEEASKVLPQLPWAGNAMLRYQSAEGEWEGALRTLEAIRASGKFSAAEAKRKRAVLLTAQAMAEEPGDPEKALRLAKEAHKLAPDLVPAATIGAKAHMRTGSMRRAAKLLETVWKKEPHPEIADAYVHLRGGDSVADRLARARKLAGLRPNAVEGNYAVAQAAIDAQDWEAAREAMKPVLSSGPTQRACLLMADIEEGQYGDKGRMRDWLSRAVRAPRDPAWTADGRVSERWLPFSPATGELDAFEWKVPVSDVDGKSIEAAAKEELLALSEPIDEAEIEETAIPIPADEPEIMASPSAAAAARAVKENVLHPIETKPPEAEEDSPDEDAGQSEEAAKDTRKAEAVISEPLPKDDEPSDDKAETARKDSKQPEAATAPEDGNAASRESSTDETDNVFPLRLPDDPGVDDDDDKKKTKKTV